jgi:hypothetical protein
MTKHEDACVAYVMANAEIKRLTRLIGIKIASCRDAKAKEVNEDPEYCQIQSCLTDYYESVKREVTTRGQHQLDVMDCPFCLEADRLIQQRKAARQTIGAAKRQITVLGNKALMEKQS